MRTDVHRDDPSSTSAGMNVAAEPPAWSLGSKVAARSVGAVRKAYVRYAEAAEHALNAADGAATRLGTDMLSVARGSRDALLHLRRSGLAATPRASGRSGDPVAREAAGLTQKAVRGRAAFRDIALRGQIAADTNVRAYLDHLDALAQAPSARGFVSAQTCFFWDQWQRSLEQTFDLQRRTVGALPQLASPPRV